MRLWRNEFSADVRRRQACGNLSVTRARFRGGPAGGNAAEAAPQHGVVMLDSMEASADGFLDDRAALEVMGWVRGGPDDEFWVLGRAPTGLTSVFRMPVTRWRPTRDNFCLDLLLEELRSRGLVVSVGEAEPGTDTGFACTIAGSDATTPAVVVTAKTLGLAVVCAAVAYQRQRG